MSYMSYGQARERQRLIELLSAQKPNVADNIKAIANALVARGIDRQASQGGNAASNSEMAQNIPSDAPAPPAIGQQGQPNAPRQSPPSPGLVPRTIMHNGDAQYLPPAQYEDSPNAYWDAQRMGDGQGKSFYDVGGEYYPMPGTPPSMGMQDAPQVAPQQNQMPYDRKGPIAPAPIDPNFDGRELLMPDRASLQPQNSFQPGAEYRTADMSGIKPNGTGETNTLNAAARSFQGLMKSLHDYENFFNADNNQDGQPDGSTAWPGARKDELSVRHRDLQMQMKELYNLGVLNGPDLDLMNQILLDPTSITGNVMDLMGGEKDMEKRIPANIQQVRQLMINRSTPALQQLGIDPQSLMPSEEDDAAFLRRLGLN